MGWSTSFAAFNRGGFWPAFPGALPGIEKTMDAKLNPAAARRTLFIAVPHRRQPLNSRNSPALPRVARAEQAANPSTPEAVWQLPAVKFRRGLRDRALRLRPRRR